MDNTNSLKPSINKNWHEVLASEFDSEYFIKLNDFLVDEKSKFKVFPQEDQIFEALNLTPPEDIKVVIIGQDPYHNDGQAHGLSFSVQKGVKIPPSLKNIYKELNQDVDLEIPNHGFLDEWAKQGVLLLNATLTVRAHEPGSHQKKGWENFTNAIIKSISDKKENVVFLLWGRFAQQKEQLIDTSKHHVLKAAHPSPFSAHNGFFGCKHFSKTNDILKSKGIETIDWSISN